MRVSLRAVLDSVQVFAIVLAFSAIHEWNHEPGSLGPNATFDKIISVGFPIIALGLAANMLWDGYAMLTGKEIRERRLRSLPHPKRNGLLYLWTGSSALVLCVLIQFTTLSPSATRDLVLACGGVLLVLAIAVQVFPIRAQ